MTDISQTQSVDIEELAEAVGEVLDGLFDATLGGRPPEPVPGREHLVVCSSMQIRGEGKLATLRVQTPGPVAYGLASAMIGESPADLDKEDVAGIMAELTNLLGGSAKAIIAEETQLEVPRSQVVAVDEAPQLTDATVVFHDVGRFNVQLTVGSGDGGEVEQGSVG